MSTPTGKPTERTLPDEEFRRSFHQQRMTLTREYGVEAYDQGEVLYRCPSCRAATVVRDAFYGREPEGPVEAFMGELAHRWFAARASLRTEGCKKCGTAGALPAVRALYAHFLPEVGFDLAFEIEPTGPVLAEVEVEIDDLPTAAITRCWRMDARGRVTRIPPPRTELDVRDQTGTFFDLRAGWRSLIATWRKLSAKRAGETVLAEVQSGYLIGVRAGVPGDPKPEERHDPSLEAHFSPFERRTYATLECLWRVGVRIQNEEARALLAKNGADVEGDQVRIPAHIVQDAIAAAPRSFTIWSRDYQREMRVAPDHVHFGPGPSCT